MHASQRFSTRAALIIASLALSHTVVLAQQASSPSAEAVAAGGSAVSPDDASTPVPTESTSTAPAAPTGPVALSPWRSNPLRLGLYGAFAALQGLDTATTLRAIHRNQAREANPLMAGLTEHSGAFIATKAAVAASTIYFVHRLSKDHPKAAVWLAVALNAGYSAVVISNFRQLASR